MTLERVRNDGERLEFVVHIELTLFLYKPSASSSDSIPIETSHEDMIVCGVEHLLRAIRVD